MQRRGYVVTIELDVFDEEALRQAARAEAERCNCSDWWDDGERTIEEALTMILDPGGEADEMGFEVSSSTAEAVWVGMAEDDEDAALVRKYGGEG